LRESDQYPGLVLNLSKCSKIKRMHACLNDNALKASESSYILDTFSSNISWETRTSGHEAPILQTRIYQARVIFTRKRRVNIIHTTNFPSSPVQLCTHRVSSVHLKDIDQLLEEGLEQYLEWYQLIQYI